MRTLCTILSALLFVGSTQALPPEFVADEELAQSPVIVVGKWEKVPIRASKIVNGNVLERCQPHTMLTVERVIKGNVKLGQHKLLLGDFIGWEEQGGEVYSYTSTEVSGDVKEVTQSNLWFLTPKPGSNAGDTSPTLELKNYRAVQPLQLEPYFRLLGRKDYRAALPTLLSSKEPLVQKRTLQMLTGGTLPWPYEPDEHDKFVGWKRRWDPMVQHAKAVEVLIAHHDAEIRRVAAAAYSEMAGTGAMPRLRQLLTHSDPEMRGIAVGALILRKDKDSYEGFCEAVQGIKRTRLACQIIQLIADDANTALVPSAIAFLQMDGSGAGVVGNYVPGPALLAQEALKAITGHDFPLEVAASQKAWKEANTLEPSQRKDYLARLLPYDPRPFKGKLLRDDKEYVAIVTNSSDKPLWLARIPDALNVEWVKGIGQAGFPGKPSWSKESFIEVRPNDSLRVPIEARHVEEGKLKSVVIHYRHNGNQFGINAWMGPVELSFDKKLVK